MIKTAIRLLQAGVAIAKNREMSAYLFFGVLTTLVNLICYSILDSYGFANMISTLLAWLASVIFAFVTNRKYVFRADRQGESILGQFLGFFFARSFTGILDLAIMYIAVNVYGMNGTLWKMISNIIVVILNYLLSKLLVFRKPKQITEEKDDASEDAEEYPQKTAALPEKDAASESAKDPE